MTALAPFPSTVANWFSGGGIIVVFVIARFHNAGHWPLVVAIIGVVALYLAFAGAKLQHKVDSEPRLVFKGGNLRVIDQRQSPPQEALTLGIANEPRFPNQRSDAVNIRAELSFTGIDIPVSYTGVTARWSNTPVPQPGEPSTQDHQTLYKHGGVESIDIALRAGVNDAAWVLTTGVLRSRNPVQPLPIGRYEVEVRLFGIANAPVGHYLLTVPKGGTTSLQLEEVPTSKSVR